MVPGCGGFIQGQSTPLRGIDEGTCVKTHSAHVVTEKYLLLVLTKAVRAERDRVCVRERERERRGVGGRGGRENEREK